MSQFPRPGATVTVNGKKYAIRDVDAPTMSEFPPPLTTDTPMDYGRRIIEAHTDDQDEADRAVRLFGTYALPGPYATYEDHARDALRALDAVRHARP